MLVACTPKLVFILAIVLVEKQKTVWDDPEILHAISTLQCASRGGGHPTSVAQRQSASYSTLEVSSDSRDQSQSGNKVEVSGEAV